MLRISTLLYRWYQSNGDPIGGRLAVLIILPNLRATLWLLVFPLRSGLPHNLMKARGSRAKHNFHLILCIAPQRLIVFAISKRKDWIIIIVIVVVIT
jgi:hypothetical protein